METSWRNIATWETVRFSMVFNGVKAVFETNDGKRRMQIFNSVSEARDFIKADSAWKVIV
jgi:hypothetical protein